jgi:hypothetical protein
VRGYAAGLAVAAQQFPQVLSEAAILIEGDNQGGIAALNSFRSPVAEINEVLKGIFEICAELRADVIGKWIPRGELTEADALSREPDATDWGLLLGFLMRLVFILAAILLWICSLLTPTIQWSVLYLSFSLRAA